MGLLDCGNLWDKYMKYDELINGLPVQDIADSLSNKIWGLTLLPTEKCNFRCKYCYENYSVGKMDRNTVEAIKKLIEFRINDNELKHFYLNWFGGEPLLAKDIIYEICEHSIELCKNGCTYHGEIITNGFYLSSKVFLNLLGLGIKKYMVAIDGTKTTHDKTRVDIYGRGTYDVIRNNILELKKIQGDFQFVVRLQICQDNIKDIYQSLDEITMLLTGDSRFYLTIVPIGKLGGMNDPLGTFPIPVEGGQGRKIINDLYDYFSNRVQTVDTTREKICHASRMNALTIRPNGRVVQCVGCLDDPQNDVGMIRKDGTLALEQEKLDLWSRGYNKIDYDLLTCPYFKCFKANASP